MKINCNLSSSPWKRASFLQKLWISLIGLSVKPAPTFPDLVETQNFASLLSVAHLRADNELALKMLKRVWVGFRSSTQPTNSQFYPKNVQRPLLKLTQYTSLVGFSRLWLLARGFNPWRDLRCWQYWRYLGVGAIALLLASCQAPVIPQGSAVQVDRIISGQTLEIPSADEKTGIGRVRLIGIEAPDLKQQPWGTEAKQRLEELINGQPVLLESDVETKNPYGQRLAYVWRDGVLLNEQLVKEGYVLAALRSPNNKYTEQLARAQEWARLMGKGIWNSKNPMRQTPSEFRAQNR